MMHSVGPGLAQSWMGHTMPVPSLSRATQMGICRLASPNCCYLVYLMTILKSSEDLDEVDRIYKRFFRRTTTISDGKCKISLTNTKLLKENGRLRFLYLDARAVSLRWLWNE
jgi:hypothetical protein